MKVFDFNLQRSYRTIILDIIKKLPGYIQYAEPRMITSTYKTNSSDNCIDVYFNYRIKFESLQEHVMKAINNDVLILSVNWNVVDNGRPGEVRVTDVIIHAMMKIR